MESALSDALVSALLLHGDHYMHASHRSFAALLRDWRRQRRMTQIELALAADSSTRHLSCLESGRAQPSREMIARLADCLNIPLRDQNALMLAAGYAPPFRERSLMELEAAKRAMDSVLQAHLPYPALAVDRHWNVVSSNLALPQIYEGCSEELLRHPINAMRLILHPNGMAPKILNYSQWRVHSLQLLQRQAQIQNDSGIRALLAEIMSYPACADATDTPDFDASEALATPLRISTRFGTVSFLNTLTVFGNPSDVTLAELALEMLFPADLKTVEIVKSMELERASSMSQLALMN